MSVDLSKYFDTLNHELLMTLLHRQIQDMRVLRLIKKYLKKLSGKCIRRNLDSLVCRHYNAKERNRHFYG